MPKIIKDVFYWLEQNLRGIMIFLIILGLGAGIAPTVEHGKRFVAAIQHERMAKIVPAYAVTQEIESPFDVYVLNVLAEEEWAVAWILQPTSEIDVPDFLYTLFASLENRYPGRVAYYIVLARPIPVQGVDGACTVIQGTDEWGMSNLAVKKLLSWGKANAKNSLDMLFEAQEFWYVRYFQDFPYLESLLQREPGHIPPWKDE